MGGRGREGRGGKGGEGRGGEGKDFVGPIKLWLLRPCNLTRITRTVSVEA